MVDRDVPVEPVGEVPGQVDGLLVGEEVSYGGCGDGELIAGCPRMSLDRGRKRTVKEERLRNNGQELRIIKSESGIVGSGKAEGSSVGVEGEDAGGVGLKADSGW